MEKAIGSRIDLSSFDSFAAIEFNDDIADLLETPEVQALEDYAQHMDTSRFQHSLNVAYYSYLLAKFFNLDSRSAARGGLLHDLFFYNWNESGKPVKKHTHEHPVIALENAKKITTLNKIEEDIIVKHMWPLSPSAPRYPESFLVSCVDKYCASVEVLGKIGARFSKRKRFAFGAKGI